MSEIIILDDIALQDRKPLLTALDKAGYIVRWFSQLDDAKSNLMRGKSRPTLFLVDMVIGEDTQAGIKFCQWLREEPLYADIPVILWSAYQNENSAVLEGLKKGGWDYLNKDCGIEVLVRKVDFFAELHERIEEGQRQSRKAIVVIDADGWQVVWKTKVADRVLRDFFGAAHTGALPYSLIQKIIVLREMRLSFERFSEPVQPGNNAANQEPRTLVIRIENRGNASRPHIIQVELFEQDSQPYREFLIEMLCRRINKQIEEVSAGNPILRGRLPNITAREAQVLFWVGEGKTNRNIAELLELKEEGVRSHLRNIRLKLDPYLDSDRSTLVTWISEIRNDHPAINQAMQEPNWIDCLRHP